MIYLFEEVLNFSDNETVFWVIFEPRKCPIFPTFVKNGRFEYQSWIFYGSQVTRKTGEILDSLQIIFFMIEFFVLQHKKENKLKSVT